MRQIIAAAVVLFLMTAGASTRVEAQVQVGNGSSFGRAAGNRPTVTPYLDLLNDSNRGGIGYNYYRRLKPEMQIRAAQSQMARSVQQLRDRVDEKAGVVPGSAQSQISSTGHAATFMNYGTYFGSSGLRRR